MATILAAGVFGACLPKPALPPAKIDPYSDAAIRGGTIDNASLNSFVGAGVNNVADEHSFVGAGQNNSAIGSNSFAGGRQAKADHAGAFVWGDNSTADFSSTADNQFLVRAAGGVGINKNNPAIAHCYSTGLRLKYFSTIALCGQHDDDRPGIV